MVDFIVVVILVAVVGSAVGYIIKEKKRGAKCIGCSACRDGGCCNASAGCCGCEENRG